MRKILNLSEIREIAQEVMKGYSSGNLPSLEDVSWAFPIQGQDGVHYLRNGYVDRIPNTQEANTLRELMTFKNFHNVLTYLSQGKTAGRGLTPHHTIPCGDAEDGAYMVYPYLRQRDADLGKGDASRGVFWKTLPKDLVTAVLKVERTGRGNTVDENGEKVEKIGSTAYVDANLTRQYLQNLRTASEMGSKHFSNILQSNYKSKNHPQLVLDANIENWDENTEFQLGYWEEDTPRYLFGKGVKDYGGSEITLLCHYPSWANGNGNEWEWRVSSDALRTFGKTSLWKLVPPQES